MSNRAYLLFAVISLSAFSGQAIAGRVTESDEQWYSEGAFLPYASPWCRMIDKSLQQGRDYEDSIAFDEGTIPSNMVFSWRWPSAGAKNPHCGVYGYDYLAWGNYAGGKTKTSVGSKQVRDIKELRFIYDISNLTGSNSFDGLVEFFLTRDKSDQNSNEVEVGWYFHSPKQTIDFANSGIKIGEFRDSYGEVWRVSQNVSGAAKSFIMFLPNSESDRLKSTIDAAAALKWLEARKAISGDLWFNGMALGAEPLGGIGSMTVRDFRVIFY